MPKTYEKADSEVADCLAVLIGKFHPHLLTPKKVTIDVVMVHAPVDEAGEPTGPAITRNGVACAGLAKIIGLKERTLGLSDGQILVDGDRWPHMSEESRLALLDHELQHFDLKRDKHDKARTDDLGRPLLAMRKHDYDFGWFDVIALRHGAASFEVQQAKRVIDETGQLYFGAMELPEPDPESNPDHLPRKVSINPDTMRGIKKFRDAMTAGGAKVSIKLGDHPEVTL
jgi:hypothetical protein